MCAALALTLVGCSEKAKSSGAGDEGKGGVKTGRGVTDSVITLGALTDMTGVYASLGKSVTQAQQLWAKQTNAAGGICDREVELTVRDHGYDPQKAVAGYTELEPKVLGFVQFIGSPPFVAAVEQRVDGKDKGLVLPQAWSANLLGSPYVRVIGATYDVETINAIDYLLTGGSASPRATRSATSTSRATTGGRTRSPVLGTRRVRRVSPSSSRRSSRPTTT